MNQENTETMHTLTLERRYRDSKNDAYAQKAKRDLPYQFKEWADLVVDVRSSEVYQLQFQPDSSAAIKNAVAGILSGPLFEVQSNLSGAGMQDPHWVCFEKQYLAGVTDNAGAVLEESLRLIAGVSCKVQSGTRLWFKFRQPQPVRLVEEYTAKVFHNSLIEKSRIETPRLIALSQSNQVRAYHLNGMTDAQLLRLSEESLWALSLEEMKVIRDYYARIGKIPTDIEMEMIAQTWSEHCKHKIFSSKIRVTNKRSDLDVPPVVDSVFKTYIKGATSQIQKTSGEHLLSVFVDNAGIVKMTDEIACAIKVETHNSPSALDPYGGALTGIVGVNRDILGAGLGAKPVANLDVFCVGPLDTPEPLPKRLHHPKRILEGVRQGVQDGGNKSGIPTVTGAVTFHPNYLGKPLVFAGTVGVLPVSETRNLVEKRILSGDLIVMSGGRVGKDGIHGATFSSMEFDQNSPVSAVQLGDPLTQRRLTDFILKARDEGLFHAVTDNGAGGLSSSVGEMARLCGQKGGALIDVDKVPLKYPGLKPYEIIVSESQERMTFAVPSGKLDRFMTLSSLCGTESTVIGEFSDTGSFKIAKAGKILASLDLEFLHEGLPQMTCDAVVELPGNVYVSRKYRSDDARMKLLETLAHPEVRSRAPIVRQYDHEVQGASIVRPYGSPKHASPNDGPAICLSRQTHEGFALGLGLAPAAALVDPVVAAQMAFDEAVRNALCAGADPGHMVLVDNFCWPDPIQSKSNPDGASKLGALVATCKAVFDLSVRSGMPFVSGKDSMKNDYFIDSLRISAPPTLLITAMGKVNDVRTVPRGYARRDVIQDILLVSAQQMTGRKLSWHANGLPVHSASATLLFKKLHAMIACGQLDTIHDVSDGGWLSAIAEMLVGTGVGANLHPNWQMQEWLAEPISSFIVMTDKKDEIVAGLEGFFVEHAGQTDLQSKSLRLVNGTRWSLDELEGAYGN